MRDILGDAAGLDVGQGGHLGRSFLGHTSLHVGHYPGGVGGQAVALVSALGPHADLVKGELLQVGEYV